LKTFGILDYKVEDVFRIFIKNAKKDFSDFNEEDPTGCKIKKSIQSANSKSIECTIEITKFIKNEKYQITSSTNFSTGLSTCTSTYTFKGQRDGTTKLEFEEEQSSEKFVSYITVWIQRFLARRNFKLKYNNIIEGLNNELKTYFSNIERSKPKKS
jgi:hypothetical protein